MSNLEFWRLERASLLAEAKALELRRASIIQRAKLIERMLAELVIVEPVIMPELEKGKSECASVDS